MTDDEREGTGCAVAGAIVMFLLTLLVLSVPFLFVVSSTLHGGRRGFLVPAWLLMTGLPLAGGAVALVIGGWRSPPAATRVLWFGIGVFLGSLLFLVVCAAFYASVFDIQSF